MLIGNRGWMQENQIAISSEVESRVSSYEEHGQTVVLVAIDGQSEVSYMNFEITK